MKHQLSPRQKITLRIVLTVLVTAIAVLAAPYMLLFTIFGHSFERNAIFALYPSTLAVLFLLIGGQWKRTWCKVVVAAWAALVIGFGTSLGINYARLAVPTVSDRSLMLNEYDPFKADTKAVTLPGESTLRLSQDEAASLRIDGATALYPVYASFAQNVFAPSEDYLIWQDNHAPTLECSGTTWAYQRLIAGEADLIFCAGPSKAQLADAEAAGVQLHLTPIGREAFVFFVNAKTP